MATSFPTTERRVFHRLTVDTHFNYITNQRVLVEWALEKGFVAITPGPYKFTLYRGYAANDDNFVAVAETVDQPWLYDNNPVLPQKDMNLFYRVVLEDAGGNTYVSQPVHATTYWERYDWTLAREIIRKEHLLYRKRAGVKGWLLKRRVWGQRCTADGCSDNVTNEVFNPNCDLCFGTGIVGGYYEPFEYWVVLNPSQRLKKLDAEQGFMSQVIETVRCLAYPFPASNDVWVNANTDQRYLVMSDVAAIARHRGIDLVLNVRMEEKARSYAFYKVPVPC